ncbi:MAG: DUF4446 family protein [Actinomycetales bacterium]|nr:DUF4446 family protein [Actinomycetales bacterium]
MRGIDVTDPMTLVAAGSAAVAIACAALAVSARRTLAAVRRSTDILTADGSGHSLAEVVAARTRDLEGLAGQVDSLAARLDATRLELSAALRHVSVVRYDAFGDMGGRMSFSTALLDDNADGLLITSIHGRSETRTYMKPVVRGGCDQLSPEEQQAINQAMGRA